MRIIAKLDVKPPAVVKPVHFEGLRKIGDPAGLAEKYYIQGADEIMYIDIVASLYQRKILDPFIEDAGRQIFVPFGVGGGVRTIDDFSILFRLGADKVVVNTHALQENPDLIDQASNLFGAQSVVINIEAKRTRSGWECYSDCGRIKSGRSVIDWAIEAQERGAGEILLQSVDCDGRKRGFDIELVNSVIEVSKVPVVAASGAGCKQDVLEVAKQAKPSAVAIASLLHYNIASVTELKTYLRSHGIEVKL